MKHSCLLLILFFSLSIAHVYAHALWIETSSIGRQGQKQSIKISYAEPGETPEKVADWYSDVSQFDLWLIGPDQQKTKLAVTPVRDHFTAEFMPQQDGVYTLAIGHTAKELGGTTKYQFNATATVAVGKITTMPVVPQNELNVTPTQVSKTPKVGQAVSMAGFFDQKPSERLQLTVSSPNGWNRVIHTNAEGTTDFTPLWPGRYWIEASKSEKQVGEQNGKPFQSVWRCATYVLDVSN